MVIEERKRQRFDLKLPFEVILAQVNGKLKAETRNLSSSGVLFTSELPFDPGEPIEYLIKFPQTPGSRAEVHLRCSGQVLRKEGESTFAATLERPRLVRRLRKRH